LETLAGASARHNELGLVVGPRHDVDFLAAQFLHDGLHAVPFIRRMRRPDRRPNPSVHGDLGATAGLARALANLDDAS